MRAQRRRRGTQRTILLLGGSEREHPRAAGRALRPMPCMSSADDLHAGGRASYRAGHVRPDQYQVISVHDFVAAAKPEHLLDVGALRPMMRAASPSE